MRRVAAVLVVLCAVVPFAAGCASDDGGGGGGGAAVDIPEDRFVTATGKSELKVSVTDNEFVDPFVVVSTGTKVIWTNDGRNEHNVIPVTKGAFPGIATKDFAPGQSYAHTFDSPGDYPYFCSIHGTSKLKGQAGVIRVVEKP
jgi:plastocyanin